MADAVLGREGTQGAVAGPRADRRLLLGRELPTAWGVVAGAARSTGHAAGRHGGDDDRVGTTPAVTR